LLEVESETKSRIEATARERGVSIDVYLRKLMEDDATATDQNNLRSEEKVKLLRERATSQHRYDSLISFWHRR
jgi:hypothetical protein